MKEISGPIKHIKWQQLMASRAFQLTYMNSEPVLHSTGSQADTTVLQLAHQSVVCVVQLQLRQCGSGTSHQLQFTLGGRGHEGSMGFLAHLEVSYCC